ncbi:hypothetical protein [Streptomyces hainanensis]|uniref:Integral membrane protein n=1 Tax=Streptomyces hainanensis TaxID=402648 RepID=A0A4R4SYG4_9ACTN|nr:hypothetical protein [Streptomyces hainanensis]TDC67552.1 hypothetical protein E1283_28690 [Streptomyces hainanensis]
MLAAFVSIPTALLTAAASYAAGRSQGRSAVDAVRRQHRRDAYTAFLLAVNAYVGSASWNACLAEARAATGKADSWLDKERNETLVRHALRIRAGVSVAPLRAAASIVHLEGSAHLGALAGRVIDCAEEMQVVASNREELEAEVRALVTNPRAEPRTDRRMAEAVVEFTRAARRHLDGRRPAGRGRGGRRWQILGRRTPSGEG